MIKCALSKRHKWQFMYNVQTTTMTLRTGSISLRGLYKCECGEKKYGAYQPS